MLLQLQKSAVYGPVNSRRLGVSLGVNVLPASVKVCTFDCVYCQYGWTTARASDVSDGRMWPAVGEILGELERALRTIDPKPAYITFSGNGEPTLHPRFGELVDGVGELRDRFAPASKTAILSNASNLGAAGVREALSRLDVRIMKLDCGTERMLRRYNRPRNAVTLREIANGLAAVGRIHIQTLLAGGLLGNAVSEGIAAWIEILKELRPLHVQLYTLDRPHPSRLIEPLGRERLIAIKESLAAERIDAAVYSCGVAEFPRLRRLALPVMIP